MFQPAYNFSLLIAKPMFVTKSREHVCKLCAVLIRKGIEIAASLGDTENAQFNFGFLDTIGSICTR